MNRSHAWICVFLASLMSGCASQTAVRTEYRNVYVPDSMLTDCPKTAKPANPTFRQLAGLADARGTDVDNCNVRWEAVREFQAREKAKEAAVTP